jgi:hypothetical protein
VTAAGNFRLFLSLGGGWKTSIFFYLSAAAEICSRFFEKISCFREILA